MNQELRNRGITVNHKKIQRIKKKLKENKTFQSMSRKGNCLDNSVMENFLGILKQEMYYGCIYNTFEEVKEAITNYIYYYNNKKIKSKLKCSPVQYREQLTT